MIEQHTLVDQTEVLRNGTLQIRLRLQLTQNGIELDHKWHRTSLEPGVDLDEQMAAVNGHLEVMGWPPVDPLDLAPVQAIVAAIHTPETVAAYQASAEVEAA